MVAADRLCAAAPVSDSVRTTGDFSEVRPGSGKDFVSALVLAALAAFALIEALRFDSPEGWTTAPGLLPFAVGCLLLAMSASLAVGAWRAGAARGLGAACRSMRARGLQDLELRRTIVVALAMCVYVLLVGLVDFDWRLPTPLFDLHFSSYELVSVAVVTFLLAGFWTGSWLQCGLIGFFGVESVAWIFRYGFAIVMPAAF
jgi:hypothetical protein